MSFVRASDASDSFGRKNVDSEIRKSSMEHSLLRGSSIIDLAGIDLLGAVGFRRLNVPAPLLCIAI